MFPKA